ncbi:uncharacterized protein LOC122849064 [Aphidius gifuensis]|uniref:uncharacterized protein LOC122849064 n=1 Tax=Aphidius gifuensis TaxID=684658 RepID=UPI001CDCC997|nr:uncharacterized protein LOC122849064 [Aphidius gifuensis]
MSYVWNREKVEKLKKFIKILRILELVEIIEEEEKLEKIRKRRKCWTRRWIMKRTNDLRSTIPLAHNELCLEDTEYFNRFFRMREDLFDQLVDMVTPYIKRQDTQMRQSITPRDRVFVTLRFLATGESYRSMEYSTRISAGTISQIIPETCRVIYTLLRKEYLKIPNTRDEWEKISNEFFRQWQFPNCLGAMDGRRITFKPPSKESSLYYNYKGTHSMVLLALVDANYQFIYVDVGINGRDSDEGVLSESDIAPILVDPENPLNIPSDKALPGTDDVVPHVILGDNAFPLQKHLIKPYSTEHLTHEERIFNYRFSRGKRIVENAIGILANRFRVMLVPMNLPVETVQTITLACCALHNFFAKENAAYLCGTTDLEDSTNHTVTGGRWRDDNCEMSLLEPVNSRPEKIDLQNRDYFKQYFVGVGQVPWQDNMI